MFIFIYFMLKPKIEIVRETVKIEKRNLSDEKYILDKEYVTTYLSIFKYLRFKMNKKEVY